MRLVDLQPHRVFLALALVAGTAFCVITPPFQAPDEVFHFYRAFQVAEGGWIAERTAHRLGGTLPKSLATVADPYYDIMFDSDAKAKPEMILESFRTKLDPQDRDFMDFAIMALYSPIAYLPQALGIALGRLCGGSPLALLYLGRLANLLCWTVLSALAVRATPLMKWAYVLLALTPMSLFLAASLSADTPTNALAFLAVALLLRLAFDPTAAPASRAEIAAVLAVSVALSLSKSAYVPILLLYLLVPVRRIGSARRYWAVSALFVLANLLAFLAWGSVIRGIYITAAQYDPERILGQALIDGVAPMKQLIHILDAPIEFLAVVLRSFWNSRMMTIGSFIGVLGWMDTPMPLWLIYTYLVMLAVSAVLDPNGGVVFEWKHRAIVFGTAVIAVLVFTMFAYMSWMPLGSPTIIALQGRYFIPISPLCALLLANRALSPDSRALQVLVPAWAAAALAVTTWVLLTRYYIPR